MGNGAMTSKRYDFEVADSNIINIRDDAKVRSDTEEFIRRLGDPTAVAGGSEAVASTEIEAADWKALSAYVLANHRAVKWYQDKRITMQARRTGYALLSIGVLALTPIAIFGLTKLAAPTGEAPPALRRALGEEKAAQTRLATAASLRIEINELNEQNKLLDALIEKLDRDLSTTTNAAQKKTLQDRVDSVKKTRDKNEDALIKKAGSIAALVGAS